MVPFGVGLVGVVLGGAHVDPFDEMGPREDVSEGGVFAKVAKPQFLKSVLVFQIIYKSGMRVGFAEPVLVFGSRCCKLAKTGIGFEGLGAGSGAQYVEGGQDFFGSSHYGIVLDLYLVGVFADFLSDAPRAGLRCRLGNDNF